MVTDEERDYMYQVYAADPQARLNVGIRRRLAPLVENSRRRIELLNSMLFSFPGTPIVYYGDEIGMGDNIYLGDRNGVRTPMQWNSGWNAGFSSTDPERLYLPLISNPVYGFSDPMSGIPNRQERVQLITALLAHGSNPNARMTKRPFIGGGEDAAGATPFLLASAAAGVDHEDAAGGRRELARDRHQGHGGDGGGGAESSVGERARRCRCWRRLGALRPGRRRAGETTGGENALFGAAYATGTRCSQLIEKGANVNAISKAGITPAAARATATVPRAHTEGAKILLVHGDEARKPCQAQEVRSSEQRSDAECLRVRRRQWLAAMSLSASSPLALRLRQRPRRPRRIWSPPTAWLPQRPREGGRLLAGQRRCDRPRGGVWKKWSKLRSRSCRRRDEAPDNGTYDTVSAWLEQELDRAALAGPHPGRPADLHRLNRGEYANAIRDLLGVDVDGAALLPPDAQAYGFDTNADALSMEPALLDRYLTAAAKIARIAVGDPSVPPAVERYTAVPGNANEQTWLWQTERLSEDFPRVARRHRGASSFRWMAMRPADSAGAHLRRRHPRPADAERPRDPGGRVRVGTFTVGGAR
jgi:hypothetical protein